MLIFLRKVDRRSKALIESFRGDFEAGRFDDSIASAPLGITQRSLHSGRTFCRRAGTNDRLGISRRSPVRRNILVGRTHMPVPHGGRASDRAATAVTERASSRTYLAQPPKPLRPADLQDVGDLEDGVHRDVDAAAFEQAHVSAVEFAGFSETLLGESLRRVTLRRLLCTPN